LSWCSALLEGFDGCGEVQTFLSLFEVFVLVGDRKRGGQSLRLRKVIVMEWAF